MHKRTKQKLIYLSAILLSVTSGLGIILYNLSENISFFVTPTQLLDKKIQDTVKLGGYVKEGSIEKLGFNYINFKITDRVKNIDVTYKGNIPIIFRDNQGVVVTGKYDGKYFIATSLYARHDEKYMPKDVKKMLKNKPKNITK